MIYLLTDNYYLSIGIQEAFKEKNIEVTYITTPELGKLYSEALISEHAIFLIAMQNLLAAKKIIRKVTRSGARFCLFIDKFKDESPLKPLNGIIYLDIRKDALVDTVNHITKNDTLRKSILNLTDEERIVLDELSNGRNINYAARKLHINIKAAYRYKISALRRMGIGSMNAKSLQIYRCVRGL